MTAHADLSAVRAYAQAVRAELADLGPTEIEELTDGLEGDLIAALEDNPIPAADGAGSPGPPGPPEPPGPPSGGGSDGESAAAGRRTGGLGWTGGEPAPSAAGIGLSSRAAIRSPSRPSVSSSISVGPRSANSARTAWA